VEVGGEGAEGGSEGVAVEDGDSRGWEIGKGWRGVGGRSGGEELG